jgi:hypothetical protein
MTIDVRKTALLCIPFLLAPPLIMVGPIGITVPEVIVALAGLYILLAQPKPEAGVHPVVILFVFCYMLGWSGALFNSPKWNVPIGLWNLTALHSPVLAALAYCVGRYSRYQLSGIVTHRITRIILIAIALFAIAYPLMPVALRQLLLAPFWPTVDGPRFLSPRFPGMGINANSYAFMVYALFLFILHAYLEKRLSLLYPLAAIVLIVALASRTVVGLTLLSAVALTTATLLGRGYHRQFVAGPVFKAFRRRAVSVSLVLLLLIGLGVVYAPRIQEFYTLSSRIEELLTAGRSGESSALQGRRELWHVGYERVKLAPVLGVARDVTRPEDERSPLYSYSPHNEFLFYWSTLGITGLVGYVMLIAYMIFVNVRGRAALPWLLLYGALIVQMTFDAAFQGVRFVAFGFMIIGLNHKYLYERRAARRLERLAVS